jgi:hypothetical protein
MGRIGTQIPASVEPALRIVLEQLQANTFGAQASAASLGLNLRISEDLYSDTNGTRNRALLFQSLLNNAWTTFGGVFPNGTDIKNCYAFYSATAANTIVTATPTIVNFQTKNYDTDGAVAVGATWKFICPKGKSGTYMISAVVTYNAAFGAASITTYMEIYKNSSVSYRLDTKSVAITHLCGHHGQLALYLNSGDIVQIRVYQSTGVNQSTATTNNYVSIQRVNGSAV